MLRVLGYQYFRVGHGGVSSRQVTRCLKPVVDVGREAYNTAMDWWETARDNDK